VRVRLDRKATSISLLVVIGVREDGQKVLLALKNMGPASARAQLLRNSNQITRGRIRYGQPASPSPTYTVSGRRPGRTTGDAKGWISSERTQHLKEAVCSSRAGEFQNVK
jgi:hypothetical protein